MAIQKTGSLFIISAPSGAGKTSLVKALVAKLHNLSVSTSYTTRKPRSGEKDGHDYFFVEKEKFKAMINHNAFLEYARVFDNYYGTSRQSIDDKLQQGQNIILEIDWQGARQVKSVLRNAVGIFILPPNYNALHERLLSRHDDTQTINFRMKQAKDEISHYKEYDYIIVNDDFDMAFKELMAIVTTTNLGACQQSTYYESFVAEIMAHQD